MRQIVYHLLMAPLMVLAVLAAIVLLWLIVGVFS
jgi:hypothetical protein